MNWKQFAVVAGSSAAAAALLYFLLKEESSSDSDGKKGKKKKISTEEATKEQVLEILKNILESQDEMKSIMKEFTDEFATKNYSFDEAYAKVAAKAIEDPLDQYGLSMDDFDRLLDRHQHDPNIKDAIFRIMGTSSSMTSNSRGSSVSRKTILDVHIFMKNELQNLLKEIASSSSSLLKRYDVKNVTLAAQAYVGAKVQKKFGLSSEDIEAAVVYHHKELTVDPEFARVNIAIHSTMNQLVGQPTF